MKFRSIVLLLACSLVLASCSPDQGRSPFASRAEVKAADAIGSSFRISTPRSDAPRSEFVLSADRARVSIHRSALDKEFLLQASVIMQQIAPSFSGMKSRVVAFRERDGKIYLLEATQGHTVTHELPQNLLLAEFPILSEQDGWITIDFNSGMSRIFVQADWRAADFEGSAYHEDFQSVEALVSYLESAELSANNILSIRQIAQLDGGVPVEVKYYLSPYRPTAGFEPVVSKGFEKFGYFEVAPQATAEKDVIYATRFDSTRPIVYSVSSNTPAEFKKAVTDGILYWNKAFGREIVRAIDAPAGVVAPDATHNVVQWLTFDNAGFAFADAQMDPRNGETLHAQVFMTSAFAVSGKAKARTLLRRLESFLSHPVLGKRVALKGFEKAHLCGLHTNERFTASLVELIRSRAADSAILRAAQDYVREVVAHEIGHTLGLRHNFAGSLAMNIPLSQRDEVFRHYLEHNMLESSVVTSSSVMEYQRFEEGAITGRKIAREHAALTYDEMAIRHLYDGAEYEDSAVPAFCTDAKESRHLDCRVFDTGASVMENAGYDFSSSLETLPYRLIEKFIAAKAPPSGYDSIPVGKVSLNPLELAAPILAARLTILSALREGASLLSVRRQFPYISTLNIASVRTAELDEISRQIEHLGGLTQLLESVPLEYAQRALQVFVEIANSEVYRKGIGPYGKPYEFSDAEIETMIRSVKQVLDVLPAAFAVSELAVLKGNKTNTFVDHALGDELATVFASKIAHYAFSSLEGQDLEAVIEAKEKADSAEREKVTVKLPSFGYSLEIRLAAVGLLKEEYGSAPDWAIAERAAAEENFEKLVKESLGGKSTGDFDLVKIPKAVRRWILEAKAVQGAF